MCEGTEDHGHRVAAAPSGTAAGEQNDIGLRLLVCALVRVHVFLRDGWLYCVVSLSFFRTSPIFAPRHARRSFLALCLYNNAREARKRSLQPMKDASPRRQQPTPQQPTRTYIHATDVHTVPLLSPLAFSHAERE